MSEHAEVQWFRDLTTGSGEAARLDPQLREVLITLLTHVAADQRERERQQAKARVDAARESELEAAREKREWQGALNAAIVGAAFRLLPGRIVVAAVLVIFTPIVASFITITPIGDGIRDIVFFPGETGSTAGSGPFTLYALLFWAALGALVATFVLDIVLGPPRGAGLPGGAIAGALTGVLVFILMWGAQGGASWFIAPAFLVIGYGIQGWRSGARRHTETGRVVSSRELADR